MNNKRKSIDLSNDESPKQHSVESNIINNETNACLHHSSSNDATDDNQNNKLEQDAKINTQLPESNSSNNIKQANQSVPINKWSLEKTLEWLNRKVPLVYENYKDSFIANQITGDILLELNQDSLEELKISDSNLKDQLIDEIAILRIKNEYEFIKRFKSTGSNIN